MSVSLLPGEGHLGDPISERIKLINAAFTALVASLGRGVATLVSGQTTITVTHGLGFTPVAGDIVVCPIEDWGAMTSFWVHTLTATEFTIEADQNPAADVDFAWQAQQLDLA